MRYIPHTESEIRSMLEEIGVGSVDDLFAPIPQAGRLGRPLAIDPAIDEVSLMSHLDELASRNEAVRGLSFLGAGSYDHHVPPLVDQMLTRGEWLTAYTPYQPEVSQGTLQAVFEFQTIVSEVLGLPIANASMYDGASSAAEGALMARRLTHRDKVLVSRALHPEYREVIRTYFAGIPGTKVEEVAFASDGRTDLTALAAALDHQTATIDIDADIGPHPAPQAVIDRSGFRRGIVQHHLAIDHDLVLFGYDLGIKRGMHGGHMIAFEIVLDIGFPVAVEQMRTAQVNLEVRPVGVTQAGVERRHLSTQIR